MVRSSQRWFRPRPYIAGSSSSVCCLLWLGAKRASAEEEDGNVLPDILLKTKLIFRGREDGGGMKQEAIASQSAKRPYSSTPELLFTKRCRRRVTS